MKKFANVIYENGVELSNHKKVDWINYIRYLPENGITDVAVEYRLPTLFIGWKNFKRFYSHLNPDILVKKLNNPTRNIWWEFSMEEKITEHFSGLENFLKNAPREYVNIFKYKSIDPITNRIETIEDLWSELPAMELTYYQYKDEMIYVLNKTRGEIYGIYLIAFKYFGLDNKTIVNFFDNKIFVKTIDSDGSIYQSFYKQFPDFDQLKRSMVLFLN